MRPGIDPKVDFAFKWLFGREANRRLLLHLLNAVLKLPVSERITDLQLLNPFSEQDALDDKLSIVDVKARDEQGRQFHVEMQILPERAFRGRVLYYWADLHQQQLTSGDQYSVLQPTISVCFTNFVLFPNVDDYCLLFEVMNRVHQLVFSQDFRLVTLELPKFNQRAEELNDPLDVWLYFLRHAETMDTEFLPVTLNTPEIRLAMEELAVLSQNDLERERYKARIKLQRDELSRLESARLDGLEQGREQGELVGTIRTYQKLLKQPLTPKEQLVVLSLEQLQQLVQQLEQALP